MQLTGSWESVSQKLRTNQILGFPLFTEAQARTFDIDQLSSASDYSDATILEERAKITDLLEQWTGASWTLNIIVQRCKVTLQESFQFSFQCEQSDLCEDLRRDIATTNFEIDNKAGFIHRTDGFFQSRHQNILSSHYRI